MSAYRLKIDKRSVFYKRKSKHHSSLSKIPTNLQTNAPRKKTINPPRLIIPPPTAKKEEDSKKPPQSIKTIKKAFSTVIHKSSKIHTIQKNDTWQSQILKNSLPFKKADDTIPYKNRQNIKPKKTK